MPGSSERYIVDGKQIQSFFYMLERCTNSYVFLFDANDNSFLISEKALERFDLPASHFFDPEKELLKIISPPDKLRFSENLKKLYTCSDKEHNGEYKFLDRTGKPVLVKFHASLMFKSGENLPVLLGTLDNESLNSDYDHLTGLASENVLRFDYETLYRNRGKVSGFILKINIDSLGEINERFGIEIGDSAIKMLADGCSQSLGYGSKLYRMGGSLLFMNLSGGSAADAQHIYTDVKRLLRESELKTDYRVMFTVSGGTIAFFNDRSSLDDLLKKLEFAVQTAKNRGKNNLCLFSASDYAKHLYKLDLQERLRISIKNNFEGFELFYQPVIDARQVEIGDEEVSGVNVVGAEALLRWSCPKLGRLSADEFIPILEESGLIIPVGRWVLLTAFTQCKNWNTIMPNFRISVNLSYVQIKKSDIIFDVQMALDRSHVNPENLILEMTESGYIDNDDLHHLLVEFANLHIKIDIDDFGTGYSNLRYLQDIRANTLKLDYTFIRKSLSGERKDSKIIENITKMAHDLDMNVCMEGVESNDDVRRLGYMKPDTYQGFLFGKPVDAETFLDENLSKYLSQDK